MGSFLHHRLALELMKRCAQELAGEFKDRCVNKIVSV